jgi:hypothetical protein
MGREATRILLSNPFTYARIHFEGNFRTIFDPGATNFLKFFDLYPKEGGLMGMLVDQGVVKTMEALFLTRPLVFWTHVVLLPLLAVNLLGACAVLFSRRLMRDPAVLTALLVVSYYLLISGGPAAHSRFRHPVMPIISILAAYGSSRIGARIDEVSRQRRSTARLIAAAST